MPSVGMMRRCQFIHHGWISHMTNTTPIGTTSYASIWWSTWRSLHWSNTVHQRNSALCNWSVCCFLWNIIVVVLQQSGEDDRQESTQGLGSTKTTQKMSMEMQLEGYTMWRCLRGQSSLGIMQRGDNSPWHQDLSECFLEFWCCRAHILDLIRGVLVNCGRQVHMAYQFHIIGMLWHGMPMSSCHSTYTLRTTPWIYQAAAAGMILYSRWGMGWNLFRRGF